MTDRQVALLAAVISEAAYTVTFKLYRDNLRIAQRADQYIKWLGTGFIND